MKRSGGKGKRWIILTLVLLKLVRWPNLMIIVVTHFIMRYFVLKPLLGAFGLRLQLPFAEFLMLSFSVVFISAAGYVINDYFDRRTDMINKPGRVIIGRYIDRRYAILFHIIFNVIAVSLGGYVCMSIHIPELIVVFLIVIGVLWFYSTTYKRQLLIGNFIVSLFAGLVPFMVLLFEVPLLQENYGGILPLVGAKMGLFVAWIGGFSLFAFLSNFIREIIKDTQDYEGDTVYGRNTVPIVWGIGKTKWVLLVLHAVFVVLLLLINIVFIRNYFSFIYTILLLVVPLIVNAFFIQQAKNAGDYKKASNLMKIIMVAGISFAIFAKYLVF